MQFTPDGRTIDYWVDLVHESKEHPIGLMVDMMLGEGGIQIPRPVWDLDGDEQIGELVYLELVLTSEGKHTIKGGVNLFYDGDDEDWDY